jgi:TatD DNase family protein
MFIDTHAHMFWENLPSPEVLLQNAKNNGIERCISVGTSVKDSERTLLLSEPFSEIFVSIGIHPTSLHEDNKPQEEIFQELEKLSTQKKCIAIGETGIDRYHDDRFLELQKEFFQKHIALAEKKNLPLIIHSRNAETEILEILHKHTPKRFVVHCFSGDEEFLKNILDLSGYISIGGVLTFKNAHSLRETIKQCPLERLMLETDTPFLAPQSVRGSMNEPANIKEIAETLAEIKGISLRELEETIEHTTRIFFEEMFL